MKKADDPNQIRTMDENPPVYGGVRIQGVTQ